MDEPGIEIRSFKNNDLDHLYRLSNQLNDAVNVERSVLEQNIGLIDSNPDQIVLVAELHSVVVGYLSAHFHWAIYANGPVAYIDEIVVAKGNRRKGIGTALLVELEQLGKTRNCILISLATAGAKAFYEKNGYRSKASYFKKYLK